MKLAILGSSPIALEAAVRFHLHGASLTWFNVSEGQITFAFPSATLSWESTTSPEGWALINEQPAGKFTPEAWTQKYLNPLTVILKSAQEVKPHPVLSITKRYLSLDEEINGKSRFLDLFRVIFLVNPADFIEKQKNSDPEMYLKLNDEFVQSLQSHIEMFEDFDLIIDAREPIQSLSVAATGRAMGEKRVSGQYISYGLDAMRLAPTLDPNGHCRELAVIGSGEFAVETLLGLQDWMKDVHTRLFLITTEVEPFTNFLKIADTGTKEKFQEFLDYMKSEWEKETETFHVKLREWQELDDFVQVKIPKPAEPIPRLNFFSGHNVTAIDQLIDRKRLFLTLEKPEFRQGLWHQENNVLDLKTIGVDHIFVVSGMKRESVSFLREDEQGFFEVYPHHPSTNGWWKLDLDQLKGIEDEIFKLFSPSSTH